MGFTKDTFPEKILLTVASRYNENHLAVRLLCIGGNVFLATY